MEDIREMQEPSPRFPHVSGLMQAFIFQQTDHIVEDQQELLRRKLKLILCLYYSIKGQLV